MEQIRKYFQDSVPEILAGLVVAAVLSTLTFLSGVFDINTSRNAELVRRTILIGWNLILLGLTVFVLAAKRRSIVNESTLVPRFGKRIKSGAALVLTVATALTAFSFVPYNLPLLEIHLQNSVDYDIGVNPVAEFMIWVDVPLGESFRLTSGKMYLSESREDLDDGTDIVVPSMSTRIVYGRIQNPSDYREAFQRKDTFIDVAIFDSHQRIIEFSESAMRFAPEALQAHYLVVELP